MGKGGAGVGTPWAFPGMVVKCQQEKFPDL